MGLSNTQKGILLALIGYNSYTVSDTCAKFLGDHYDVITITFWVYFVTLALCVLAALIISPRKALATRTPVIHIIRGFLTLFLSSSATAALSGGLSLDTLYTFVFLIPALTTIAAIPVYKEYVSKKSWLIIALGLAGVFVAFHSGISLTNPKVLYAFAVVLISIAINFCARPISKSDHFLTIPFYPALIIVLSLLIYKQGSIPLPDIAHIPVFLTGGCALLSAMFCVIQAFRTASFAKVAPVQYTQMLSGLLLGYLIFGDVPNMWMMLGAGMIIASGLLLITQKK